MKLSLMVAACGILFLVILGAGCTSSQVPPATVPPTTVATAPPTPTPTAVPYPDALSIGQYANFGTGDMLGNATVYKVAVVPNYSWTSPSFNSAREQSSATLRNGTLLGYNIETPKAGDNFVFVYVRMYNTGPKAVYAPSPMQFTVSANGNRYNYSSVHGSDVVINAVSEGQYDYQIGPGGAVGYIQPGNMVQGFLIYDVPASVSPKDMYFVVSLDFQHEAIWKLG